eukprot:CAMPEP_0114600466 /NCGR_PEP_ID=MMETSP0125-20121206/23061_1 /TAXON_ID=485358 ORGANISM="Aristerostoma sp., Strain ATCC 50986" /NCGR_SAMPLE_ID=MMETSP0125 /ASSEMBLY_ACC=CAM_ASM_000245 /LENGTH=195 /DNA_ID=CAMNT_0001808675 /DNA_START=171 /DNA_END=758 /DNA_ORIENTATION=+
MSLYLQVLSSEKNTLLGVVYSLSTSVSLNEILENEFRISKIASSVVVGLSVDSGKGLLKIFEPPDESLEIFVLEDIFIIGNQFLSSVLDVFFEQVSLEDFRFIFKVGQAEEAEVDNGEHGSHPSESDVIGEDVVVISIEGHVKTNSSEFPEIGFVLNDGVGHIIIPFGVKGVQDEGLSGDIGAGSVSSVDEVDHL